MGLQRTADKEHIESLFAFINRLGKLGESNLGSFSLSYTLWKLNDPAPKEIKMKVKINGKPLTEKQLDTKTYILFKEHEKLIERG